MSEHAHRVSNTVAAGHPDTVRAARRVLDAGGNAVDGAVAAAFTATVVEPLLCSLAGGGFGLVHEAGGADELFDFFVDVPSGDVAAARPMDPVDIHFPSTSQTFSVGWSSVAVPGVLAGLLRLHDRHGRLDPPDVLAPAIELAAGGVEINEQQAGLFSMLEPIFAVDDYALSLMRPGGSIPVAGTVLVQADAAGFLRDVATDPVGARRRFAEALVAAAVSNGGLVTLEDMASYEVVVREPAVFSYRGLRVVTNPPPSLGGSMIGAALAHLDAGSPIAGWDDPSAVRRFIDAQRAADALRRRASTMGTTHLSVADAAGNVVSLTMSNGAGSGCAIPGTGVLANNMLGEDDLFPNGLGSGVAGSRVASMMSPTIVRTVDGQAVLALGSGGSKRIRTAITQVIARHIDHEPDLRRAVTGPRVHDDGARIEIEPGLDPAVLESVVAEPHHVWERLDLYFGGVHAVHPGRSAAGDPRRGGAADVWAAG